MLRKYSPLLCEVCGESKHMQHASRFRNAQKSKMPKIGLSQDYIHFKMGFISSCRYTLRILKLLGGTPSLGNVTAGLDGWGNQCGADQYTNPTTVGSPSKSGPLTQGYTYNWIHSNPLIQRENITTLLCPDNTTIISTSKTK